MVEMNFHSTLYKQQGFKLLTKRIKNIKLKKHVSSKPGQYKRIVIKKKQSSIHKMYNREIQRGEKINKSGKKMRLAYCHGFTGGTFVIDPNRY